MITDTIIHIDSDHELTDIIMRYQIVKICIFGDMYYIDELPEDVCPNGLPPTPNTPFMLYDHLRIPYYSMDVTDDYIELTIVKYSDVYY